jgi:hypothetical protein
MHCTIKANVLDRMKKNKRKKEILGAGGGGGAKKINGKGKERKK